MRVDDRLLGLSVMVLGGAILILSAGIPLFPGQSYGPDILPRTLAVLLLVCGGLLALRGQMTRQPGQKSVALMTERPRSGPMFSFALVVLAVVFYVSAAKTLGFLATVFLILAVLFLRFDVGWRRTLVLTPAAGVAIYLFFEKLLGIPLPRGWVEAIF